MVVSSLVGRSTDSILDWRLCFKSSPAIPAMKSVSYSLIVYGSSVSSYVEKEADDVNEKLFKMGETCDYISYKATIHRI